MTDLRPYKTQNLECADGTTLYPIANILGHTLGFVALTLNGKVMVFNDKLVDEWLISKYALSHYMIIKLPEWISLN